MATEKAILTVDGNVISIDWKDFAKYFSETHLDIRQVRSLNIAIDAAGAEIGVQLILRSHNSEIFHHGWFATINGNAVTTNAELLAELLSIWKGVINAV